MWFAILILLLILLAIFLAMWLYVRTDNAVCEEMTDPEFIRIQDVQAEPERYVPLGIVDSEAKKPVTVGDINTVRMVEVQDKIRNVSRGLYFVEQEYPSCYRIMQKIAEERK